MFTNEYMKTKIKYVILFKIIQKDIGKIVD